MGINEEQPPLQILGLAAPLNDVQLNDRREAADAWCEDMGASSMDDVLEFVDSLTEHLALRPWELKRWNAALRPLLLEKAKIEEKGEVLPTEVCGLPELLAEAELLEHITQ